MFTALYDYFYDLFTLDYDFLEFMHFSIGDVSLTGTEYFALITSIISLVLIFVLCCLFIGKIIKTIGRLFSGGVL